jgi:Protein of unknown function (DUF2523)
MFDSIKKWFAQLVRDFLDWLLGGLSAIFGWIYAELMFWLSTLLHAIPVPEWITTAGAAFSGIPPSVMWFAGFLQLGTGLSITITAYGIRFFIRRIPVIG